MSNATPENALNDRIDSAPDSQNEIGPGIINAAATGNSPIIAIAAPHRDYAVTVDRAFYNAIDSSVRLSDSDISIREEINALKLEINALKKQMITAKEERAATDENKRKLQL